MSDGDLTARMLREIRDEIRSSPELQAIQDEIRAETSLNVDVHPRTLDTKRLLELAKAELEELRLRESMRQQTNVG